MGIKLLFASHKKAVIAFITTAVVVTACIIGYLVYRDKYLAITMRIQRLVGDVVLTDDSSAEMNYEMTDSTHYAGYIVIPASMSSGYIVISITPNE